jgi:DNA invertase Pin-like site-specific DNA recombinase
MPQKKIRTRQEIAELYGISYKTLKRRLIKVKITLPSGDVSPNWQREIFDELGYPNDELLAIYNASV